MNWKGIVGRNFSPEDFRQYVAGLNWDDWQPGFIVLHNTGEPTLLQRPEGLTYQHILGLEAYYRDDQGWSGGPHLFVDDRQILGFHTSDGARGPFAFLECGGPGGGDAGGL